MVRIQNITGTWLFHVIPKSDNICAGYEQLPFSIAYESDRVLDYAKPAFFHAIQKAITKGPGTKSTPFLIAFEKR
ncbi:hypothetical protein DXF96_17470 [Heyndrickxia coagulans]|uniref:Uncharacterized protein n=1 Tax=Heyndrickxia coagulans 36D1 TaxID=345219 RepID=G2TN92_HEYCO|nr:hypothetical protein Bcoa_2423 [Heyndrickxia coagulans 36D1]AVD56806.1 hypothetical protein C3766_11935 [Heyndrickxia coagulans]KGT39188.1 hypothetical protein P421_05955 [Heyndrickxia coagulans P38]AWP37668.1 hypothetical protein CYJ15_11940 [Heyndrickxia coagulans]KYC64557.1 hypothetical protein B4100_2639 [Heyndrickxia coagulans]